MSDDRKYLTWEVWCEHDDRNGPLLLASFTYKHEAMMYAASTQAGREWAIISVVDVGL